MRLRKINLETMEKEMPVLDNDFMDHIVAGDGESTWDCLFNIFIYFMSENVGVSLDKLSMVHEYIHYTESDPIEDGGANIYDFMNFISKYHYLGLQNTTGSWNAFDNSQWAAFDFQNDNSSILHFAIPMSIYEENGVMKILCYDPTVKKEMVYNYSALVATFDLSVLC